MDTIIALTDDAGRLIAPDWLARAEAVHRQLRPALPADYRGALLEVFAGGGRMAVAARGERVSAVAVWRIHVNTAYGKFLYVDDLVTDEALRSSGAGRALLAHCRQQAHAAGCRWFTLDSGTHRTRAHRFYFREGMHVSSFHFVQSLRDTAGASPFDAAPAKK